MGKKPLHLSVPVLRYKYAPGGVFISVAVDGQEAAASVRAGES